MAQLSDKGLKALKPRTKSYQVADGKGLYVEVLPSGAVSFRYQYRIAGKKERAVLGTYPALPLAAARRMHREYQTMVEQGISPARRVQEQKHRPEACQIIVSKRSRVDGYRSGARGKGLVP